jgi:hypothetical protein
VRTCPQHDAAAGVRDPAALLGAGAALALSDHVRWSRSPQTTCPPPLPRELRSAATTVARNCRMRKVDCMKRWLKGALRLDVWVGC